LSSLIYLVFLLCYLIGRNKDVYTNVERWNKQEDGMRCVSAGWSGCRWVVRSV